MVNEVEKTISSMHHNNESNLNLLEYMKNKSFVLKIQSEMLEQADLKIKVCNNILSDIANIGRIFNYAQEVDIYKENICNKINLLNLLVPDSYIEPFLLAAGYYLILEYSPENYHKYIEIYIQKKIKQSKHFESKALTEDNLYQVNNILLMLSGEKTNYGQVVFCSDSIMNVCGGRIEAYRGKHVSTLFTPSFQAYYYDAFKRIFAEEETLTNKIQRAFIYHKNGYIVEVELYFKIHPNLTQGLFVTMIMRPTNASKEYLLVKEDGSIEGATRGITDDLNLHKSGQSSSILHNVKLLSEELWNLNQAFNSVVKAQKQEQTPRGDNTPRGDKKFESKEYQKALRVYNAYTSETIKTGLMSTDHSRGTTIKNKLSHYECNVSLVPCGSTFIKVIELVKLNSFGLRFDSSERSIKESEYMINNSKSENTMGNRTENDDNESQINNMDFEENIHSQEMITEWKKQSELNEMMSPRSLPSTHRLLIARSPTNPLTNTNTGVANEIKPSVKVTHADNIIKVQQVRERVLNGNNENEDDFMNSTHGVTTNLAFRNALKINFRPKSFRAICLLFYGVIIFTFLSQLVLKIISDNTTESLQIKKTLLSLSQLRAYKMLFIVINCRRGVNNIIDPSISNGVTFSGMATVVNNLNPHKILVLSYNKQILENAYLLNDEIKQNLFANNIRINGTYTDSNNFDVYKEVNNFGLVDNVVDAIQKLTGIKNNSPNSLKSKSAYDLFNYILLNVMDDYLYNNEVVTNLFMSSVNKEKNYVQLALNLCFIITPLILVGIVIMLTLIVWKQYNMEKKHMMTFIRLKPKSIKDLLERLNTFKKILADREPVKLHDWLEFIQEHETDGHNEQHQESNYHKRHDVQVIQCSETRVRYFGYILKVVFYIAILIGIMLWNYGTSQKSMNAIYRRQRQIEFLYHMSVVVSVTYCAVHETFGSNNTNLIMHKKARTALYDSLAEVRLMRNQMAEILREEDGSYDPVVENLAFQEKNCDPYGFVPPNLNYCIVATNKGQMANLNYLLSLGLSLGQEKLNEWETCNKTSITTLLNCSYNNVDNLLPPFALGAIEAQTIGDVINVNLERSISDAHTQRNVFLIVFSVCLAIASLLIWLQVLRKVRDLQNGFKKVLQLFPPRLVFSSFLLKKFLGQHKTLRT